MTSPPERDKTVWMLELMLAGNFPLVALQLGGDHSEMAGLLRRVSERMENQWNSPYHECCECETEEPDWGDCPNCSDIEWAHCDGCLRSLALLTKHEEAGKEANTEALALALAEAVHGCDGGVN